MDLDDDGTVRVVVLTGFQVPGSLAGAEAELRATSWVWAHQLDTDEAAPERKTVFECRREDLTFFAPMLAIWVGTASGSPTWSR